MSTFILGLTALGSRPPTRRFACRTMLLLLFAGSSSIALGGLLAGPALAAGPQVTITCTTASSCTASGSGFTPSGTVVEQGSTGSGVFSSSNIPASGSILVCATGGIKPVCHYVGGGYFTAPLPVDRGLACDATAPGTVSYTDSSSHVVVTKAVTFVGPCISTTTALALPASVDTTWTAATNPAVVTAGSTTVTSGTVTITVNGVSFCSYTAGDTSGCTLAGMPVGTNQVQASYSGTPVYGPSSASASIVVYKIQAPQVTTLAPSWVTSGEATLNGTVNPEGAPTTYYFEYGADTWPPDADVPVPSASVGSGIAPATVWYQNEPIYPDRVYHVRLVATNEDGTTYGAYVEFTTPPTPPVVRTDPATNVTQTGATLHGWLAPEFEETKWHFDYGTTSGYGSQTPDISTDDPGTPEGVLTGLQPGTTYHYRLEATNVGGTAYGADGQFTTAGGASSGPYGFSQVPMYNCASDGDDVDYWAFDETTGGSWQDVGSQADLYADGVCPGAGSSPVVFTPNDRQVYELVAVDAGLDGCSGDDPSDSDCIAESEQVEGDSTGPASPPFEVY